MELILAIRGILVAAKACDEVERVGPLLSELRGAGPWMSDALVARVMLRWSRQIALQRRWSALRSIL